MNAARRDVYAATLLVLVLIGGLTLFQSYTYRQLSITQAALAENVAERRQEHRDQTEAHRTTHGLLRQILDAIRAAPAERGAPRDDLTPGTEGGDS